MMFLKTENLVQVDVNKCGLCSLPTDASGIMFYFKCIIDHIKEVKTFLWVTLCHGTCCSQVRDSMY